MTICPTLNDYIKIVTIMAGMHRFELAKRLK